MLGALYLHSFRGQKPEVTFPGLSWKCWAGIITLPPPPPLPHSLLAAFFAFLGFCPHPLSDCISLWHTPLFHSPSAPFLERLLGLHLRAPVNNPGTPYINQIPRMSFAMQVPYSQVLQSLAWTTLESIIQATVLVCFLSSSFWSS